MEQRKAKLMQMSSSPANTLKIQPGAYLHIRPSHFLTSLAHLHVYNRNKTPKQQKKKRKKKAVQAKRNPVEAFGNSALLRDLVDRQADE